MDMVSFIKEKTKERLTQAKIYLLLIDEGYSVKEIESAFDEFRKSENDNIFYSLKLLYKRYIDPHKYIILIVMLSLLLISSYFLYFAQFETVEIEGEKYYLDVSREYVIPDVHNSFTIELNLSKKLQKYYQEQKSDDSWIDPLSHINTSKDEYFIELVIDKIQEKIDNGETEYVGKDALAFYVTRLVQNLEYDHITTTLRIRKTRYPYETLYDKKGVCRETAVLLAKFYKHLGYKSSIIQIMKIRHAIVGIGCKSGSSRLYDGYCMVEPTSILTIGENPYRSDWGTKKIGDFDLKFFNVSNGSDYEFKLEE